MSPRLWMRTLMLFAVALVTASVFVAAPAFAAVSPQAEITLPSGSKPWSVATARDGSVWVSDESNSRVFHLSNSGALLATVPVGLIVYDIALTPNNQRLYVANYGDDTVSVIDTTSQSVIGTIVLPSGTGPIGVAVSPSGDTVYVSGYNNKTLVKIDVASAAVTTFSVSGYDQTLALSPDGSRVYMADYSSGNVQVLSTADGSNITTLTGICPSSYNMVTAPLTHRIYATCYTSTVVAIDTTTNSVVTTIDAGSGSYPRFLDVSPDESELAVTFMNISEIKLYDTGNFSLLQSLTIPPGSSVLTNGIKFAQDGASLWAALDSEESMWKLTVDPPLPRPTATPALASTGRDVTPIIVTAGILLLIGACAFAYAMVLRKRRDQNETPSN